MTPSVEYRAILALKSPPKSRPGDMWLCRRLGIVRVFNNHKRGTRRGLQCNAFHLYHFSKPAMWSSPADWRDNDPNSHCEDPALGRCMGGETWEYVGNMFELLPYETLAAK